LKRKAAAAATIRVQIAVEGTSITFKVASPMGERENTATLGQEFSGKTPKGDDFTATITLDNGAMKLVGPDIETNRVLEGDKMVETTTKNGVTMKRIFKRE
jgi:hypothetical protein